MNTRLKAHSGAKVAQSPTTKTQRQENGSSNKQKSTVHRVKWVEWRKANKTNRQQNEKCDQIYFVALFLSCLLCAYATSQRQKNITITWKCIGLESAHHIICTVVVDVMLLILLTSIRCFDVLGLYWTWCCTSTQKERNFNVAQTIQQNYYSIFTSCIRFLQRSGDKKNETNSYSGRFLLK